MAALSLCLTTQKRKNMAANTNCPTLKDFILADDCSENFGGMATTVYVFKRKDLAAGGLTLESNSEATYKFSATPFVSGGRLWKFDCKRESQQVQGESQIARALNTGDLGFIVLDNDGKCQILYDTNQRCEIESGGLTTDTGAAASDDRQMTVAVKLGPVAHPNYFLNATKADLEALMTEAS